MTKDEKIAALQAKADDLIKWFDDQVLPAGPFKMNTWSTITDTEKFFSTNKGILDDKRHNPFSRLYVLAYYRLLDLKKHIECKSNNSQPPPNNAAD